MYVWLLIVCLGLSSSFRRWFKGSDTTIIAKFLEWLLPRHLADCDEDQELQLTQMLEGLTAINSCLGNLYHQPLWIQPATSCSNARDGMKFLSCLLRCADYYLSQEVPRFKLMPKAHMFAHAMHKLWAAGSKNRLCMNVLSESCQMDEDFVGRISSQSRNVAVRTVHSRTLQRFCLNLGLRWT